MKLIMMSVLCALSFSAAADTAPPAPNYIRGSLFDEPLNTVSNELDDDPEQPVSLDPLIDIPTVTAALSQGKSDIKTIWQRRMQAAAQRGVTKQ